MVELLVVKRGVFGWLGGEVAFLQAGGPLDVAVLLALGVLAAAVGGDDEFRGKSVDFVLETVEPDSRDLDFKDTISDMLELALVVIDLDGGDRRHAGLETAGSIGIGGSESFEKVRQLGVRLQLESHHRAAWPTMDFF
jgi:hypothetical protein